MKYKIRFPTGWMNVDPLNDNMDINVARENGEVYWGTIFTIKNIMYLMEKESRSFFWSDNMLIVNELNSKNINDLISNIVDVGSIERRA